MSTNADASSAAKENDAMTKSRNTTTTATPTDDLAHAGVNATEFNAPDEAILEAEGTRGLVAIELKGRWFTIAKRDARRLLKAKVRFAYLRDRRGQVYTVRAR